MLEGSDIGASIAVNGCCLTLIARGDGWWETDVSDETVGRTNIGALMPGDRVNLERPMALGERLGGHIVLGHVDAVGSVVSPAPDLHVRIPQRLMRYVVEKGSVTVDGISLTVNDLPGPGLLGLSIIEYTWRHTTLSDRAVGDDVHLEADVIGKFVQHLLQPYLPASPGSGSALSSPQFTGSIPGLLQRHES